MTIGISLISWNCFSTPCLAMTGLACVHRNDRHRPIDLVCHALQVFYQDRRFKDMIPVQEGGLERAERAFFLAVCSRFRGFSETALPTQNGYIIIKLCILWGKSHFSQSEENAFFSVFLKKKLDTIGFFYLLYPCAVVRNNSPLEVTHTKGGVGASSKRRRGWLQS